MPASENEVRIGVRANVSAGRVAACAVVVLNCNGRQLLSDCLDSLQKQTVTNFETVVVDNGSSDGSLELLAEKYPLVRVLPLGTNMGFSIANNVAIRDAMARNMDDVLLLNNDTIVAPDFVAEMLAAIAKDERIGAVCPKIYFASEPTTIWYAGGGFSPWSYSRARHRGWREVDRGQFDSETEITLATGCAMLVRCSALPAVGLLDEKLWAYMEDTEWSVRFLENGYKLVFAPRARVWHHSQATWVKKIGSGSHAPSQYLATRNCLLIARRHARWWQIPTYVLGFLLRHVTFYTALRLWRRDFRAAWAIYRGIGAFIFDKPSP
jgi:hypothetical protein